MRLHDFIRENREQILMEWETFASTCEPASTTMDVEALRDHADQMLMVIAKDLGTHQGADEQSEKSKGQARASDRQRRRRPRRTGRGGPKAGSPSSRWWPNTVPSAPA